jgi:predicted outer membrane protein
MRIMSRIIRLTSFGALGLASLVAYGASPAPAAQPAGRAMPPSGLKATPHEVSPHAAFSDCSVGNVLGMAEALTHAAIERAKMAEDRAQDPAVKQFAERVLDDHQKLDQELSKFESDVGAQPVETDVSSAIERGARRELKGLEEAKNFDREYIADEIAAHIKAAGFLHVLLHAIHEAGGGEEGGGGEEQGQPTGGAPVPQPGQMGQPTLPGPVSFPQPGQISIPQPGGMPQLPQPGTFGAPGAQLPGQFGQGFPGTPNFGNPGMPGIVGPDHPSSTTGQSPQEPVTGTEGPSEPGEPGEPGATEGQPEPKMGDVAQLFKDAKHTIASELTDALQLESRLVGVCGEESGEAPATKKAPPRY